MNKLQNRFYEERNSIESFWYDLGSVFKNCRLYYKNPKAGIRKQCDSLRCLAYYLYKDWFNQQKVKLNT
jgi:hypothetical protein